MKRSISRGITLALLILLISCVGSAVLNRSAYTPITINNYAWAQATVRVYCRYAQIDIIRVDALDDKKSWLNIGRCDEMFVRVSLLGASHRVFQSGNVVLLTKSQLQVDIHEGIETAYLSTYPR